MSNVRLTDNFNLSGSTRTITDEGYLKATAALTCVGVQKYSLADFTGKPEDANKVVSAYRPASTVFAKDTMASAALRPVTMHHPSEKVNSENHQHYSIGTLGENVYKLDDHRLAATILINNKAVVKQLQDGIINHLSMGYQANVKPQSGTFEGAPYDYIFDGAMDINHCAIVPKGRCGANATILDKANQINEETMKEDKKPAAQADKKDEQPKDKAEPKEKEVTKASEQPVKTEKPTEPEMKKDAADTKTVNVKDAVAERVALLDKAKPFISDADDLHALDNRQILQKIFDKADFKDRSDEYLMARLDANIEHHKDSKKQLTTMADAAMSSPLQQEMLSVVDMLKL